MKNPVTSFSAFSSKPKKGITAIVAVVLLLMMTVGAAGLAYIWVTSLQGNIQEQAGGQVEEMAAQQDAKIAIDSMWNQTGNISFTMRNSGKYAFADMSSFRIYIDGVPVDSGFITGLSGQFASGATQPVNLKKSFPLPGTPKTVKLSTNVAGVAVTYRCSISTTAQTYC